MFATPSGRTTHLCRPSQRKLLRSTVCLQRWQGVMAGKTATVSKFGRPPHSAILGVGSHKNALVRGPYRHRWLGYPQKVLTARRGELERQERSLRSSTPRCHFRLFSPVFLFCPLGGSRANSRLPLRAPRPKSVGRALLTPSRGVGILVVGLGAAREI